MRIVCPGCGNEIPAADVNVAEGVAVCPACNEVYKLAALTGSEPEVERVEKPRDTKIEYYNDPGRSFAVALPKGGPWALRIFLTIFALFWNCFIWVMWISMWMSDDSDSWIGRLFLIPFVFVGFGLLIGALWAWAGRSSIAMDRDNLLTRHELFGYKREKVYPVIDITKVGPGEAYRSNDQPVYGVGVFLKDKSSPVVFGSGLKEEEKKWLTWEIYRFWKEVTEGKRWP